MMDDDDTPSKYRAEEKGPRLQNYVEIGDCNILSGVFWE